VSYDFRVAWLLPDTDLESWAHSDTPEDGVLPGVASAAAIKATLRDRLLAGPVHWETAEEANGTICLTTVGANAGTDVHLHDYDSGIGIAYNRPAPVFEAAWHAIKLCAAQGAVIYDGQLQRVIDPAGDHALCRESYLRTSRFVQERMAAPLAEANRARGLDRLPYLWRWLLLCGVVLLAAYVVTVTGLERRSPLFALSPFGIGCLLKMFWLDPQRMRSMGWPERLKLLNLLPPYAPILQLQLFCYAPRDR